MTASGLTIEDYDADVVEVWPECWPAFELFARLRTQWTVGMNGLCGLRYEAVYPLLDRMHLSPSEWEQMFSDLQEMESAALSASHSN